MKGSIIGHILQIKLKRLREVMWPTQAQTARVWRHMVLARIHSLPRVCQVKQQSPAHDLSSAACLPASAHPGEEKEASREELGEVGGKEREREKEDYVFKAGFPCSRSRT